MMVESAPEHERSLQAQFEYEQTCYEMKLSDREPSVPVDAEGRYTIRRVIGRGAMGCVFGAYDAKLKRDVALKSVFLHGRGRARRERRLMKEAEALAAVNHPNVLTVFDVVHATNGELLLAVVLVHGQPLSEWQVGRRRQAVLDVYLQAGAGLVAAHERGIVHRDFKPANVMIDDTSTPLAIVCDFGLAGGPELRALNTRETQQDGTPRVPVTVGAIGTPAYMSPEQRAGGHVDARSDEYSFCVALWEGLAGTRPFQDEDQSRDVAELARPRTMPRWLFWILRRGLERSPARRFFALRELLQAIEVRRRRRAQAFIGSAIVIALGGVAAFSLLNRADPCAPAREDIARIWSEPRRAEIVRHIESLDVSYAAKVAAYSVAAIDRAVGRWGERWSEVCTGGARDSTLELYARRQRCLIVWTDRLDKRVDELSRATPSTLDHVEGLLKPIVELDRSCQFTPPLLDSLFRALLEEAESAELEGDFSRAHDEVESALAFARNHGDRCSDDGGFSTEMAYARYREGHLLGAQGRVSAALDALQDARNHANACAVDEVFVDAQLYAAKVLALDDENVDAARDMLAGAGATLARLGDAPRSLRRFEWFEAGGLLARTRGEYATARQLHNTALDLIEADTYPLRAAEAHINIAVAAIESGDFDLGMSHLDRAEARLVATLGAEHPETRRKCERIAVNRGLVAFYRGEPRSALSRLEPALESQSAELRLKASTIAAQAADMIAVEGAEGDDAGPDPRVITLLERLRSALTDSEELPWRDVAEAHQALGTLLLMRLEDPDAAVEHLRAACSIWRDRAPEDENGLVCRFYLATALVGAGRLSEATAHVEQLASRRYPDEMAMLRDGVRKLADELKKIRSGTDRISSAAD